MFLKETFSFKTAKKHCTLVRRFHQNEIWDVMSIKLRSYSRENMSRGLKKQTKQFLTIKSKITSLVTHSE